MPKSIKNVWDSKLTFDKLVEAHERASKGKRFDKEVLLFEMNLETNITNIIKKLENNTYRFGKVSCFYYL